MVSYKINAIYIYIYILISSLLKKNKKNLFIIQENKKDKICL
jgi:hypothetical protein